MRLHLRGALAVAVLSAACGKDSVGPKSPADPQATTAQLQSLGSIFDVPALNSLSAVSDSITPTSAVVPALQLAAASNPLMQSRLRPYAERIEGARVFTRLVPQMSVSRAAAAAALFPPALLGKTFEWNFTALRYDTTARTGAPGTGVRFILYAIDELTGSPAGPAPGVEVGYIDLMDETGSGNPKVHVIVAGVGGTPVYVDYTVTLASQSATSVKITTAGYITNGASSPDSLRFNGAITLSGSPSSVSVTEDVSFDVNSHDIHVRNWQRVTFADPELSLRISFRFEHAGEVVTLDGTLDVNESTHEVSGSVTSKVDGGLFATCNVNGTSSSFTLTCTGADDDGLNADEHAALDALGEAAGNITSLFEGILLPAIAVLAGAA
ncbi:MAG TPA: hypothetical protein VGQ48_03035 [Gemmatimonadales bacterium]|jgi:hypothetical protein|nr:hypothetical protein [Gemmatimonadales bacterium]